MTNWSMASSLVGRGAWTLEPALRPTGVGSSATGREAGPAKRFEEAAEVRVSLGHALALRRLCGAICDALQTNVATLWPSRTRPVPPWLMSLWCGMDNSPTR